MPIQIPYYPNPYFKPEHLIAAFDELAKTAASFQTLSSIELTTVDKISYSATVRVIERLTNEVKEIALCLDSMRTNMSYARLASASQFSVDGVKTILKHKRPKGMEDVI